ncbi:trafficking protein particle complex subunit 9-like [Amphibalanus amphitrite]|uniref:trafficking protein particle complex subunit 9-like n=1 Tax=Amphibalanus amphitrite TaxID=1232801 RepID=UPI001C928A50|nr:trafficking protein particle complex subunit 9-like [Amphibalanus amphitrite]XP_043233360.1 trafficking protein particle complex subunit 9-like [Amphibalanus amphitrite]
MRSSVSVILSDPPPDSAMSFPDYQQTALDHQSLLILVKQVGQQLKPRTFNKLYDRISRLQQVTTRDSQGARRAVWLRYRRWYPAENNDWGEFQSHRRVLGLITLGHVTNQAELNDVCKQHESLRSRYAATLYDSRCVVLGMPADGRGEPAPPSPAPAPAPAAAAAAVKVSSSSLDRDSGVYDHSETAGGCASEATSESSERADSESDEADGCALSTTSGRLTNGAPPPPPPARGGSSGPAAGSAGSSVSSAAGSSRSAAPAAGGDPLTPPGSFRARTLCYAGVESCDDLDVQLQEFANSLFWVLEAKRVDKSAERADKLALLCAPFERKDFVGLDMESRSNKKRCMGRAKKHMGDLSLQTGLPAEAMGYYTAAAELLRQSNDWLWLAGCFEGMCAASVAVLYPDLRRAQVQRNASLNQARVCRTGRPSASNSLPHGIEPAEFLEASRSCLTPAEIVDKYRESVVHYSKYRHAGVIETECSLKAVHVLIEQCRYLMAAEFLQNVVFINLQLSDDEKIQRFTTLSELYSQCGFHRKAAFFRRVAAMRFVASQNPQPSWSQCYQLLLQAMDGYRLGLDPSDFPSDRVTGWSALQTQLLQELVGSARRMGNTPLAVRHLTFLLHAMFGALSGGERAEFAAQLEALSVQCQPPAAPGPLALETGLIIPPVNLYCLPVVRRFRPLEYPPHLRPQKLQRPKADDHGPFIFSPLQFGSLQREKRDREKLEFRWVEGELSQVQLLVENLLPADLRVTAVSLLADGAALDVFPSQLTLAANSGPHAVNLVGAPQAAGQVTITGYTATVLGVRSNCRLKQMDWVDVSQYLVDAVPALPQIQVSTSASKLSGPAPFDSNGFVSAAHLTLYAGESRELQLTLQNSSSQPVELLELELQEPPAGCRQLLSCRTEQLQQQLPLAAGAAAQLNVTVTAEHEFVLRAEDEEVPESASVSGGGGSGSQPPSLLSSAAASLPSRLSSALSSGRGRRLPLAESTPSLGGGSMRSSSSGGRTAVSSVARRPSLPEVPRYPAKTAEAVLKVRYSGGPGLPAGYCRAFSVLVTVDVVPSVYITKWDVLPAETPSSCYLVLDVLNATEHELELEYTAGKKLLMEGDETCRVPVPLERCPLANDEQDSQPEEEPGIPPALSGSEQSASDVTDHVTSRVTLGWRCGDGSDERSGRADLRGVTWSDAMLDHLRVCPVTWEVLVDGRSGGHSPAPGRTGDVIRAAVRLTNGGCRTLSDVTLTVSVYQDHENGAVSRRLETRMAVAGALRHHRDAVAVGDSLQHSVGFIFFSSGLYKLELRCTAAGGDTWTHLQALEVA